MRTFGALTGAQAVQMVRGGLEAIYLSGWQVAADANLAVADVSRSEPLSVQQRARARAAPEQRAAARGPDPVGGRQARPRLDAADRRRCGSRLRRTAARVRADEVDDRGGRGGVHFEDQLASEKKCGHLGGKVLVPTSQFIRTLVAARLAADVCDVPTLDRRAHGRGIGDAADQRHRRARPSVHRPASARAEGYFRVRAGLESAIARALAYAPYADVVWCETSTPDIAEAKRVRRGGARAVSRASCSPTTARRRSTGRRIWTRTTIARFQSELGAMGYKFQFITLAGWHLNNLGTFELAHAYAQQRHARVRGAAGARVRARDRRATRAVKHQREVGVGLLRPGADGRDRRRRLDRRARGIDRGAQFEKPVTPTLAVG